MLSIKERPKLAWTKLRTRKKKIPVMISVETHKPYPVLFKCFGCATKLKIYTVSFL